MKKLIQNWLSNMFDMVTQEEMQDLLTINAFKVKLEQEEIRQQNKQDIEIIQIQADIGRPFISVSNEWENPIIGIVVDIQFIDFFGKNKKPVAKIYDFISNTVYYSFNKRLPYSEYNLQAILKLDPFQRWNLMACSNIKESKARHNNKCLTPEEIVKQLYQSNFTKVLQDLTNLQGKKEFSEINDLPAKIIKILKSNQLNTKMTDEVEQLLESFKINTETAT